MSFYDFEYRPSICPNCSLERNNCVCNSYEEIKRMRSERTEVILSKPVRKSPIKVPCLKCMGSHPTYICPTAYAEPVSFNRQLTHIFNQLSANESNE